MPGISFRPPSPSRAVRRCEREDSPTRVAIIGSGISGLSAAWLLAADCEVTLYEAEPRLGGHSNTVLVESSGGPIPVDTGFIVYNELTYPNLTALLHHLGVSSAVSGMSFSVSSDISAFAYAGHPTGLAADWRTWSRPRFWRMLADLLRFYHQAPRDARHDSFADLSLGDYVRYRGFSNRFVDDHLLPMAAAIWSAPMMTMLDYPLESFVRFCDNHGLLQFRNRPQWRNVIGGSRRYIAALIDATQPILHLAAPVRCVERSDHGAWITDQMSGRQHFDHVVIAAHADQALAMLSTATVRDRYLLGAIRYQANRAVLHRDSRFMPSRRRVWASWNYLANQQDCDPVSVTYWMNKLQNLPDGDDIFVTLNPKRAVTRVIDTFDYEHPLFDRQAVIAQKQLWQLQGQGNVWFCGAYFGAGFHEDGLQAGLAVAEAISGRKRPWQVAHESGRIHVLPGADPIGQIASEDILYPGSGLSTPALLAAGSS